MPECPHRRHPHDCTVCREPVYAPVLGMLFGTAAFIALCAGTLGAMIAMGCPL